MIVPPQKNSGGFFFISIKATIQGKSPRRNLCPLTMSPEPRLDTPQDWTFARLGSQDSAVAWTTATIAKTQIRPRMLFRFIAEVNRSITHVSVCRCTSSQPKFALLVNTSRRSVKAQAEFSQSVTDYEMAGKFVLRVVLSNSLIFSQ